MARQQTLVSVSARDLAVLRDALQTIRTGITNRPACSRALFAPDDVELDDLLARLNFSTKSDHAIKMFIASGVVSDVYGLPDGWSFEVESHDACDGP